jgi:hypothetical protein
MARSVVQAACSGSSSGLPNIAATLPRIPRPRWAKAVASAGTRAIAPPRTRSWVTAVAAVELLMRSRIVSASRSSKLSVNSVRPIASGR